MPGRPPARNGAPVVQVALPDPVSETNSAWGKKTPTPPLP